MTGFINMNFDRHVDAHYRFFNHLVEGDGDSAEKHRSFYDEYLSVMDLTEEFYLQTIKDVFQEHKLARGEMTVRDRAVRPEAITDVALLTVEGENFRIRGEVELKSLTNDWVSLPLPFSGAKPGPTYGVQAIVRQPAGPVNTRRRGPSGRTTRGVSD